MDRQVPVQQVLREREVRERTGIRSRSGIYQRLNKKSKYYDADFPRPFRIGKNAIAWDAAEIDKWLIHRMATRL